MIIEGTIYHVALHTMVIYFPNTITKIILSINNIDCNLCNTKQIHLRRTLQCENILPGSRYMLTYLCHGGLPTCGCKRTITNT